MRILFGLSGAVVGAIVGLGFAFFVAVQVSGSNDLFIGFVLLYGAPPGVIVGAAIGILAASRLRRYLTSSNPTAQKILLLVGIIVGLSMVSAGMLWAVHVRNTPPSDEKLLVNFQRHEAAFNELVEMLKTDTELVRVDVDWTDPDNPTAIGVSPTRIINYREKLRDARVPRGFIRGNGNELEFLYWIIGSAISSDTTKGYAYLPNPPINLHGSLDDCKPDEQNGVKAYRHIRGNWYLFYEFIPG